MKAHSPRALLLFWHGAAAAAVDSAAACAGYTAPPTDDMTYLVQGVPLRLWPASRGLAFPIPFLVFFSADERRCAAHVDSLTLHDTISIDL